MANSTKLEVPVGSLFEDVLVNVYRRGLDNLKIGDLAGKEHIIAPSSVAGLRFYEFDIENLAEEDKVGLNLKDETIITIHYDLSGLDTGWKENELAIFCWDRMAGHWIKVGGRVDTENKTVSAHVNRLEREYAVLASPVGKEPIQEVRAYPNPFTPYAGKDEFKQVKVSFTLDKTDTYQEVEIKIFSIVGEGIIDFTVDGSDGNGEFYWDGLDKDGNECDSGVYVYQIKVEGETYSGAILLVK